MNEFDSLQCLAQLTSMSEPPVLDETPHVW